MYIIEFLIKDESNNYKYLEKAFFYKFICQNIIIKHYKSLLNKLKTNKEYNDLLKQRYQLKLEGKSLTKINNELKNIRIKYGISKGEIYKWTKPLRNKYSKYISSQMFDDICDDVLIAIEKIIFSDGKELHFKRLDDIHSLSAKSIKNGFMFKSIKEKGKIIRHDYFTINCPNKNINLHFKLDIKDKYELDGFRLDNIKYIKITRRIFNNGYKYYIQFVTEGIPPLKLSAGIGSAGIDPGISSVAVTTNNLCLLEDLDPLNDFYNKKIISKQRSLERKNRQNNPDCYNKNGTIKKGFKLKLSNNAKRTKRQLRTLYRKKKEFIKHNQNLIGNKIIQNCDNIYCEDVNFKALQKRSKNLERSDKESTINTKNGIKIVHKYKKKKRFGKSLQNRAPAQFIKLLENKCKNYEIPFVYIKTQDFKASQYNHQKDDYIKKELSDRWNELTYKRKKIQIQRDLYSAFLIKNSDNSLSKPNIKMCKSTFNDFVLNHNKCIDYVKENNKNRLSCFGF